MRRSGKEIKGIDKNRKSTFTHEKNRPLDDIIFTMAMVVSV